MPPLVDVQEVQILRDSLVAVSAGVGFVLWVDPLVNQEPGIASAEILQHRLRFMLRIAAYSSYVLGERVVKIGGVGHEWPPRHDPTDTYLRTTSAVNYLRVLVRSGFSSLERIADWATDPGRSAPLEYASAVTAIVRSLAFVHASGLPRSERLDTLDLWLSDTRDLPADGAGPLPLAGHLIEVAAGGESLPGPLGADPASAGQSAAPAGPLAIRVVDEASAERAALVLRAAAREPLPRPVVLRVSERYPGYRDLLAGLDPHRQPIVVAVDVDLAQWTECDRALTDALDTGDAVRRLGFPLAGVAFAAPPGSTLQAEFDCAFRVLQLVLEQRVRQDVGP